MTVTTRTNLATNPNVASAATNLAAVPGTGGTAAGAQNTGTGQDGSAGFYRVTWSVATTAGSGGASYTQTGLAASTQYTHSLYVRSNRAQTVALTAQYQNSSAVNVGSAATGTAVTLAANTWTQVTVTATSGTGVDRVVLTAAATSGGLLWAANDTLDVDSILVEAAATAGTFFDGSYVSAAGVVYAWTGAANASTATATTYQPVLTLTQGTNPSPYVQVTFQDLDPGTNVINLWRTADGKRRPIRGERRLSVVGSGFVNDYEAPLGRTISYDMEILSGVSAGVVVTTATATISGQASGWLTDPLVPSSAVPVYPNVGPNGEPGLDLDALGAFDYKSAVTILPVMGTDEPVALIGQRQATDTLDVNVTTLAANQSGLLRTLVKQAGVLLFRPLPGWASALPGLCYCAADDVAERPETEKFGGTMVAWKIRGPVVAPPALPVAVASVTYGTVSGSYSTYAAFAAAHTGQTYLDVIKNP